MSAFKGMIAAAVAVLGGITAPNANGPMQRYQVIDPQLRYSWQVGFVNALEAHQAAIDQMLATQAP